MREPRTLRGRDLARVAARTPLFQAAWNYERQQGVGLACCLQPALRRIYADPGERAERLAEHVGYFNTQPVLASLAVGAVASMEERRAAGGPDAPDRDEIARVKTGLGSALAASGDALFWSTLRPLAACLGVLAAQAWGSWGAWTLLLSYNLGAVTLRVRGVWMGYRAGPGVLSARLRARIQSAIGALSSLAVASCGLLVAVLLVPGPLLRPLGVQAALVAGMVAGLATAARPRPSATQWALVLGGLCVALTWR